MITLRLLPGRIAIPSFHSRTWTILHVPPTWGDSAVVPRSAVVPALVTSTAFWAASTFPAGWPENKVIFSVERSNLWDHVIDTFCMLHRTDTYLTEWVLCYWVVVLFVAGCHWKNGHCWYLWQHLHLWAGLQGPLWHSWQRFTCATFERKLKSRGYNFSGDFVRFTNVSSSKMKMEKSVFHVNICGLIHVTQ